MPCDGHPVAGGVAAMVDDWRGRSGTSARDFGSNGRGTIAMGNVNLFDTHNRINFPTDAQIADYPAEAQERFKPVREAKAALDRATDKRKSIEQQIVACDTERTATQEGMSKLRPNTEAEKMANIKNHILSEQRQRRLERGLSE
jgi:hypothetical protein